MCGFNTCDEYNDFIAAFISYNCVNSARMCDNKKQNTLLRESQEAACM